MCGCVFVFVCARAHGRCVRRSLYPKKRCRGVERVRAARHHAEKRSKDNGTTTRLDDLRRARTRRLIRWRGGWSRPWTRMHVFRTERAKEPPRIRRPHVSAGQSGAQRTRAAGEHGQRPQRRTAGSGALQSGG